MKLTSKWDCPLAYIFSMQTTLSNILIGEISTSTLPNDLKVVKLSSEVALTFSELVHTNRRYYYLKTTYY